MHQIQVNDRGQIPEAISWCKQHVNSGRWHIQTNWPRDGFVFSFDNTQDATWFGLHWVQ